MKNLRMWYSTIPPPKIYSNILELLQDPFRTLSGRFRPKQNSCSKISDHRAGAMVSNSAAWKFRVGNFRQAVGILKVFGLTF